MRVRAGLGAEDFQRGAILFAKLCPCPWCVLWYHVLAIPVHHRSVLCLWLVLCLWWGGCLTVVGCLLCRRPSHVSFCLRGGGGLGHASVAVLEGGNRAGDFRVLGVAVEPQWFCHRCRWRGWGLGLVSGVVQEDLPVTVSGIEVPCMLPHSFPGPNTPLPVQSLVHGSSRHCTS